MNIDETGHREKGKRFWTWVFRAGDFAVFHIDKTRSAGVLERFLENGDAYLRFIANPKVEPTNNPAEQAIRQVVIDRIDLLSHGLSNFNVSVGASPTITSSSMRWSHVDTQKPKLLDT